jgi:hypothetical protein
MVVELVKLLPLREAALLLLEACEPGTGEDETDAQHHQREHRCVTETLNYFWTRPEGKQAASQFGWARSQTPRDLTTATVLGSRPYAVHEKVVLWLSSADLVDEATRFARRHRVKHLVVVANAHVTEIGQSFLYGCHVQSVLFVLPGVTSIGNNWMMSCTALANPQFQGLDSLQTVGDNWMWDCGALTNPRFQGLGSLQTIGNSWMAICNALRNPQFQGLGSLRTVGDNWMEGCSGLIDLSFVSLQKVETVGKSWLRKCASLRDVSFVGMISLRSVGSRWMAACPDLRIVDLRGLRALETVGQDWMSTQEKNALSTFEPRWGKGLQSFQTGERQFWNGLKLKGRTIKKKR